MSNRVLYRTWRPQCFNEVAGQEHICTTLRNAVKLNKVAHAYLFTGPRGVGKTSTARILAKALNCAKPKDGEPDDACPNCLNVRNDKMLDLIEIDAASNRGIDDVRAIRQGVRYSPLAGGWKIYIVDEVHMLTEPAFNALLKTLEEPPPKIALILATTEAHKIPATIVSRCQRFDFRRITDETIVARLQHIAQHEKLQFAEDTLQLIASSAQGSLRDAIGLLEQTALALPGQTASAKDVAKLLGLADWRAMQNLSNLILESRPHEAIKLLGEQFNLGAAVVAIHKGLMQSLRTEVLTQAGTDGKEGRRGLNQGALEHVLNVMSELETADFRKTGDPALTLELAVLRACLTKSLPLPSPVRQPAEPRPQARVAPTPAPQATTVRPTPPTRPSPPKRPPPKNEHAQRWERIVAKLRLNPANLQLANLLTNVEPPVADAGVLELKFLQRSNKSRFDNLTVDETTKREVRRAIDKGYETGLTLRTTYTDNRSNTRSGNDLTRYTPLVRYAISLGSEVVSETAPSGKPT